MFVPYQALNRLPSDPEADDIPICHSASLTKHYLGLDQTNANAYHSFSQKITMSLFSLHFFTFIYTVIYWNKQVLLPEGKKPI